MALRWADIRRRMFVVVKAEDHCVWYPEPGERIKSYRLEPIELRGQVVSIKADSITIEGLWHSLDIGEKELGRFTLGRRLIKSVQPLQQTR